MNNILLGIGIVLVVAGLFSQFYAFTTTETDKGPLGFEDTDVDVNTPYQSFALPLMILGAILIIVSAFINRT